MLYLWVMNSITNDVRIFVYGGGEIGQALLAVLGRDKNDTRIDVCDEEPEKATCAISEIGHTLPESDLIFLCVPSLALECVVDQIAVYRTNQPVIVLTKGLTPDHTLFPAEVLEKQIGEPYGVLAGPMLAEELRHQLPSRALCAGPGMHALDPLFADTTLSLSFSDDAIGASVCGVMKNIYSIGLGISTEFGLGVNAQGALISRAVQEMEETVSELGGRAETVTSVAGIGDLVATGTSEYSSNFSFGQTLVQNGGDHEGAEGKRSIEGFTERYPAFENHPFLKVMYRILVNEEGCALIRDAI